MTPIVGALLLAVIVSIVFFTKDGRALFEEFIDGVEDRVLLVSNLRQRWRERSRRDMTTATHKRTAWE